MKRTLSFSKTLLIFLINFIVASVNMHAATISFDVSTDKDPNKSGVQICAFDAIILNATLNEGENGTLIWQYNDNNGNFIDWVTFAENSLTVTDDNNPKSGSPFCRQYRLMSATWVSNIISVCAMPDIGAISINAPDFVCQDASNTTVTADVANAIKLTITRTPGGTGVPISVIGSPLVFNHNETYWGPITFTARAIGCVDGIFTPNARVISKEVTVRRALNTPYSENTVIAGPTNVCKGDVGVYTASNSRAFGDPQFNYVLNNPTAGTLVDGGTSSNGSKTIKWNTNYTGPNPVKLTVTANGCLNPIGQGNGAVGFGGTGTFDVFFNQKPIVNSFSVIGTLPICPEICRTLKIDFNAQYTGNKKVVMRTDDGNPDVTYTTSNNALQIQVCPAYTTIYTILSVEDDKTPEDPCAVTGPYPDPMHIAVTQNTASTPLSAAPSHLVKMGTNIKLTTFGIGGDLKYSWRKVAGMHSSQTNIQGPNDLNDLMILGDTEDNSGTYQVTVQGACGEYISQNIAIAFLKNDPDNSSLNQLRQNESSNPSSIRVYPSPTQHRITIDINKSALGTARVDIVDLTGRIVKTQKMDIISSMHQLIMDVSDLVSGCYIVKFMDNNHQQSNMKIIRQ